jgi:hypothetical protein
MESEPFEKLNRWILGVVLALVALGVLWLVVLVVTQ